MLSAMLLCCFALGRGILGWPLLVLCLCCRFCWCPSFRRLHNDVFLVGVCGCGFRLGVLLCGRGVSCLVCCLFCGLCHVWFYVGIRVLCWVSDFRFCGVVVSCAGCLTLVGVRCLVLCVCLPFLRWVFAFSWCMMASFTCMSVFLRLGVCFC